jgi:hypothetical protein
MHRDALLPDSPLVLQPGALVTITLSRLTRRYARFVVTTMAIIGMPSAARGQDGAQSRDIAALTTALDAADLATRAEAVAVLGTIPPATLPAATKLRLVSLLEREATTPVVARPDDGEDSERGIYLVQLVRTVVRLQHPASLRGLALLGIQTSLAAQKFVASQGDSSVAMLAEAERADTNSRGAVAETRGMMLGEYAARLSPGARATIRVSLLATAPIDPLAFSHGVAYGRLYEATPVLVALAAQSTEEFDRGVLGTAAAKLATLRDNAPTSQILDGLFESIAALCAGAKGGRQQTCQSMVSTARLVFDHLREARPALARQALRTLAAAATDAMRRGTITPTEGTMIAGTATYLVTRV